MAMQPGSVVTLKSGGPLMTIEEFGEHKDARCTWFHDGGLCREWFGLVALRVAPTTVPRKTKDEAPKA